MIDENKTLEKYGYSSNQLSTGSSKKIIVCCDYCSKFLEKPYKARLNQNRELDKDCCENCKFQKREELSLLKYGVKNSSQRPDVKDQLTNYNIEDSKEEILSLLNQGYSIANIGNKLNIPSTSLNRYLKALNVNTKGDLQKKKEKTFAEKYGDDYKEQFSQKRKLTNLEKFGCDNPFASEEIKEKITNTIKEKYGFDHHMRNPNKKLQVKQTNLEKYGHENVSQVPQIQDKIKSTNLEKYGYEQATKNAQVKSKIINTMIANGNARVFEGLGSKSWAEKTGYCLSRFNQLIREYGFETAKNLCRDDNYSSLEANFKSFLSDYNITYSQQFRINLENNRYYIADFKLDNNILIECDGLYWHSEQARSDHKYHLNKQNEYEKQGFKGLFFREDEIRDKFDIVKSIVLNKLNKSNRIFARKCELGIINDGEADNFFNLNHLMGKGRGKTFVLTHDNNVVAALRLKRMKNNDYEISRFCNINNTNVVGGFSKLLKFSIDHIKPDSITTFIDKRYGSGSYLSGLGFVYKHTYPSFKWTDGFESFHRLKFPGNSGYDQNLFKIWDCGQAKWILEP